MHVTLKFLGEVEEKKAEEIRKALKSVKMAGFVIDLEGIGTYPPDGERINVVWVGCRGPIAELASKIEQSLEPLGFAPDKRGFSSHITLARVQRKPEALKERIEKLKNTKIGVQRIDSFVLKSSVLTPKGPIYQDVETFVLSA
jgi:2'-5' RNA ligase